MLRWLDMIAAQQPLRRVALDVGMHAAAGMVDFLPRMKERLATCTLIEDVEYARHGDVSLRLDILQPKGLGPHPVLIYLHGGAFAIVALAVTLAFCARRPEPFAAPLFERGLRPIVTLLYYGFLQASMPQRYRRSGVSAFAASIATDAACSYLGKSANHPAAEHALSDPLCVVEAMAVAPTPPPIFMAAGLDDPVAADSQRLEQALQRLQSAHSAHYYPGETHGFHVMFWREQAVRCWRDSFEFLRQYLPVPVAV